jgi:erythromycin esterase-like protein
MTATLDRLMDHHGSDAKAVVWEHNSHVGDARWTDMAEHGMVNVGQLVREAHAADGVVIVGFGGYVGSVTAADRWGGRTQQMRLPPARRRSTERLLHDALDGQPAALFVFADDPPPWADRRLGHRAVGVAYHSDAEWGNYVPTVLGRRYDAFCWIDETSALTPLQ